MEVPTQWISSASSRSNQRDHVGHVLRWGIAAGSSAGRCGPPTTSGQNHPVMPRQGLESQIVEIPPVARQPMDADEYSAVVPDRPTGGRPCGAAWWGSHSERRDRPTRGTGKQRFRHANQPMAPPLAEGYHRPYQYRGLRERQETTSAPPAPGVR